MSSRRAARPLGLVALLLALAAAAGAAPKAEVYRVQHRTAEELLPYAEASLGSEGRVVVDPGTNSLVLLSERADLLHSTLALLAAQDRSLRTVVLDYASRRTSELTAAGARIDWGVSTGPVRIGNLRVPPGDTQVRVSGDARSARGSGALGGTVRILEGHAGRISAGESVPVTTRSRYGTSTTYVPADSGFEARARVLGDGRVQLELRPFEARYGADSRIETAQAATTLVLTPGRTVVIGGLAEASGAASFDANAADRRRASDERVLEITARIE